MKLIPRRDEVYAEPVRSSTVLTVEGGSEERSPFGSTAKGTYIVVRPGPDAKKTKAGQVIMVPDRTFTKTARGILVEEKYISCDVVESDEFNETKPYPIEVPQMVPLSPEEANALVSRTEAQA